MTDIREYNETYDCFPVDLKYKSLDILMSLPEIDEVKVDLNDMMLDKATREAVHGTGEYALWKAFFWSYRIQSDFIGLALQDDYDAVIAFWNRCFEPIITYYQRENEYGNYDIYGLCWWKFRKDNVMTREEAIRCAKNRVLADRLIRK